MGKVLASDMQPIWPITGRWGRFATNGLRTIAVMLHCGTFCCSCSTQAYSFVRDSPREVGLENPAWLWTLCPGNGGKLAVVWFLDTAV